MAADQTLFELLVMPKVDKAASAAAEAAMDNLAGKMKKAMSEGFAVNADVKIDNSSMKESLKDFQKSYQAFMQTIPNDLKGNIVRLFRELATAKPIKLLEGKEALQALNELRTTLAKLRGEVRNIFGKEDIKFSDKTAREFAVIVATAGASAKEVIAKQREAARENISAQEQVTGATQTEGKKRVRAVKDDTKEEVRVVQETANEIIRIHEETSKRIYASKKEAKAAGVKGPFRTVPGGVIDAYDPKAEASVDARRAGVGRSLEPLKEKAVQLEKTIGFMSKKLVEAYRAKGLNIVEQEIQREKQSIDALVSSIVAKTGDFPKTNTDLDLYIKKLQSLLQKVQKTVGETVKRAWAAQKEQLKVPEPSKFEVTRGGERVLAPITELTDRERAEHEDRAFRQREMLMDRGDARVRNMPEKEIQKDLEYWDTRLSELNEEFNRRTILAIKNNADELEKVSEKVKETKAPSAKETAFAELNAVKAQAQQQLSQAIRVAERKGLTLIVEQLRYRGGQIAEVIDSMAAEKPKTIAGAKNLTEALKEYIRQGRENISKVWKRTYDDAIKWEEARSESLRHLAEAPVARQSQSTSTAGEGIAKKAQEVQTEVAKTFTDKLKEFVSQLGELAKQKIAASSIPAKSSAYFLTSSRLADESAKAPLPLSMLQQGFGQSAWGKVPPTWFNTPQSGWFGGGNAPPPPPPTGGMPPGGPGGKDWDKVKVRADELNRRLAAGIWEAIDLADTKLEQGLQQLSTLVNTELNKAAANPKAAKAALKALNTLEKSVEATLAPLTTLYKVPTLRTFLKAEPRAPRLSAMPAGEFSDIAGAVGQIVPGKSPKMLEMMNEAFATFFKLTKDGSTSFKNVSEHFKQIASTVSSAQNPFKEFVKEFEDLFTITKSFGSTQVKLPILKELEAIDRATANLKTSKLSSVAGFAIPAIATEKAKIDPSDIASAKEFVKTYWEIGNASRAFRLEAIKLNKEGLDNAQVDKYASSLINLVQKYKDVQGLNIAETSQLLAANAKNLKEVGAYESKVSGLGSILGANVRTQLEKELESTTFSLDFTDNASLKEFTGEALKNVDNFIAKAIQQFKNAPLKLNLQDPSDQLTAIHLSIARTVDKMKANIQQRLDTVNAKTGKGLIGDDSKIREHLVAVQENFQKIAYSADAPIDKMKQFKAQLHTGIIKSFGDEVVDQLHKIDNKWHGVIHAAQSLGVSLGGVGIAAQQALKNVMHMGEQYSYEIFKFQQLTGMSMKAAGEWVYATKRIGLESRDLVQSMKMFERHIVDSNAGVTRGENLFRRYGITLTNANGSLRDVNDVLLQISDVFETLPAGIEKTNLQRLFSHGIGGDPTRLIHLLSYGRDTLVRVREEANRLGGALEENIPFTLVKLEWEFNALKTATMAFASRIMMAALPVLKEFVNIAKEGIGFLNKLLAVPQVAKFVSLMILLGGSIASTVGILGGLFAFFGGHIARSVVTVIALVNAFKEARLAAEALAATGKTLSAMDIFADLANVASGRMPRGATKTVSKVAGAAGALGGIAAVGGAVGPLAGAMLSPATKASTQAANFVKVGKELSDANMAGIMFGGTLGKIFSLLTSDVDLAGIFSRAKQSIQVIIPSMRIWAFTAGQTGGIFNTLATTLSQKITPALQALVGQHQTLWEFVTKTKVAWIVTAGVLAAAVALLYLFHSYTQQILENTKLEKDLNDEINTQRANGVKFVKEHRDRLREIGDDQEKFNEYMFNSGISAAALRNELVNVKMAAQSANGEAKQGYIEQAKYLQGMIDGYQEYYNLIGDVEVQLERARSLHVEINNLINTSQWDKAADAMGGIDEATDRLKKHLEAKKKLAAEMFERRDIQEIIRKSRIPMDILRGAVSGDTTSLSTVANLPEDILGAPDDVKGGAMLDTDALRRLLRDIKNMNVEVGQLEEVAPTMQKKRFEEELAAADAKYQHLKSLGQASYNEEIAMLQDFLAKAGTMKQEDADKTRIQLARRIEGVQKEKATDEYKTFIQTQQMAREEEGITRVDYLRSLEVRLAATQAYGNRIPALEREITSDIRNARKDLTKELIAERTNQLKDDLQANKISGKDYEEHIKKLIYWNDIKTAKERKAVLGEEKVKLLGFDKAGGDQAIMQMTLTGAQIRSLSTNLRNQQIANFDETLAAWIRSQEEMRNEGDITTNDLIANLTKYRINYLNDRKALKVIDDALASYRKASRKEEFQDELQALEERKAEGEISTTQYRDEIKKKQTEKARNHAESLALDKLLAKAEKEVRKESISAFIEELDRKRSEGLLTTTELIKQLRDYLQANKFTYGESRELVKRYNAEVASLNREMYQERIEQLEEQRSTAEITTKEFIAGLEKELKANINFQDRTLDIRKKLMAAQRDYNREQLDDFRQALEDQIVIQKRAQRGLPEEQRQAVDVDITKAKITELEKALDHIKKIIGEKNENEETRKLDKEITAERKKLAEEETSLIDNEGKRAFNARKKQYQDVLKFSKNVQAELQKMADEDMKSFYWTMEQKIEFFRDFANMEIELTNSALDEIRGLYSDNLAEVTDYANDMAALWEENSAQRIAIETRVAQITVDSTRQALQASKTLIDQIMQSFSALTDKRISLLKEEKGVTAFNEYEIRKLIDDRAKMESAAARDRILNENLAADPLLIQKKLELELKEIEMKRLEEQRKLTEEKIDQVEKTKAVMTMEEAMVKQRKYIATAQYREAMKKLTQPSDKPLAENMEQIVQRLKEAREQSTKLREEMAKKQMERITGFKEGNLDALAKAMGFKGGRKELEEKGYIRTTGLTEAGKKAVKAKQPGITEDQLSNLSADQAANALQMKPDALWKAGYMKNIAPVTTEPFNIKAAEFLNRRYTENAKVSIGTAEKFDLGSQIFGAGTTPGEKVMVNSMPASGAFSLGMTGLGLEAGATDKAKRGFLTKTEAFASEGAVDRDFLGELGISMVNAVIAHLKDDPTKDNVALLADLAGATAGKSGEREMSSTSIWKNTKTKPVTPVTRTVGAYT